MSFFKKLFKKKEKEEIVTKINSCKEFWDWFLSNEQDFFDVVKKGGSDNIATHFLTK